MEKIRNLEVCFEDKKLGVTVSMGIAINKSGNDSAESLIKKADNALYIAKGSGRDQFKFHKNID